MRSLSIADRRCLEAAEGWLELGNWQEANAELESITPCLREHPAVLGLRWNIHAAATQWELAAAVAGKLVEHFPDLPFGWIQLAHSLHALDRTAEAREVLLPLVDRFPGQFFIPYKLACYECQLGHLKEARQWLETALELADNQTLQQSVLQDPELKPLWS